MEELRMAGGRTVGAVWVAGSVRKPTQPSSPSVHAVLRHLEAVGFDGAPRSLGVDDQGRQVLSYLPGETVGEGHPWPAWVWADATLAQVGAWLRRLHDITATFPVPEGAVWFGGRPWQPGYVIGHHDAAPYNAVLRDGGRVGFVDWDTAGPSTRELDLAYTALWWVPLHARHIIEPTGFTAFDDRARRLHLLLDAYGYRGDRPGFVQAVADRARRNATVIRRKAAEGDPIFRTLSTRTLSSMADDFDHGATEIEALPATFMLGVCDRTSHHLENENDNCRPSTN